MSSSSPGVSEAETGLGLCLCLSLGLCPAAQIIRSPMTTATKSKLASLSNIALKNVILI